MNHYRQRNHQKRKAVQKLTALINDYFFTDFEEIHRRKRRGVVRLRALLEREKR